MKLFITCIAGALFVSPALAQTATTTPNYAIPVVPVPPLQTKPEPPKPTGLADIIRAKFPLSVRFGDLGQGWREIDYQGTTYYTRGETHLVNDQEFLVAYRASENRPTNRLSGQEYVNITTRSQLPRNPDDRLGITLIGMKPLSAYLMNGQTGVRSFDATKYRDNFTVVGRPSAYYQNLSLVYLRKLNDAFQLYSNAYLQTLPEMESAFAARQALEPFAENEVIFTQPGTTQPFKFNPLLSGRKKAHLKGKGYVVLVYEAVPASDGSRAVLLYNGRVQRVSSKTWEKMSKASFLD